MTLSLKLSIVLRILLTGLFFHQVNPLTASQNGGRISGAVVDGNGNPVPSLHALLKEINRGDVTDSNGQFIIEHVPDGVYTLILDHVGFTRKTFSHINLENQEAVTLDTLIITARVLEMHNVVISATRTGRNIREVSSPINRVNAVEISRRNAKNPAEALREETGVFVQKTSHGGGSVIIRGLSSSQILLLVDGIRMNNATYRLGNHAYLTTVDKHILGRIEVLRGPSSVLYGSDAMGGVINLITRLPDTGSEHFRLNYRLQSTYESADQSKSGRAEFSVQNKKWGILSGFSYADYGDLRRGTNSDNPLLENATDGLTQSPSGFQAMDFDIKAVAKPTPDQMVILAWQKSGKRDVPRYDKYENDGYDTWYYDPVNRDLIYLTYQNNRNGHLISSMKASVSFHRQEEGRKIRQSVSDPLTEENDCVGTWGTTLQMHSAAGSHYFTTGADVTLDRVDSRRWITDAETGNREKENRGRYPDGARYDSFGAYLQDEIRLSDRWTITPALRYSLMSTRFSLPAENEIDVLSEEIDQRFNALTAGLGLVWKAADGLFFNANAGQAFRAPNLSDLSKLGESKGTTYEVPNTRLEPEKVTSVDLGMKWKSGHFQGEVSVYYALIRDLLASAATTWNGESTILIGETEYSVKSKQNIGQAFIRGIECGARFSVMSALHLYGSLSSTYGQNTTANEPVGGIPPLFGTAGLDWRSPVGQVSLFTRFAGRQERLSADDLDDPRIPDGGTPEWMTLNFRSEWLVGKWGTVRFAVENILDVNYREHGSGINGPGRNIIVSLEINN